MTPRMDRISGCLVAGTVVALAALTLVGLCLLLVSEGLKAL